MKIRTIFICLVFCVCNSVFAQSPNQDSLSLWKETLDSVWQTVQEYHYDSTFGGLDWHGIHSKYEKLISTAGSDSAVIRILNDMLHELKLSHYAVFRKEAAANSGSSLFSEASVGIDLRVIDGDAIIINLDPGFPADSAGMKMGDIIRSINGVSVKKMIEYDEAQNIPNNNEQRKIAKINNEVMSRCYGMINDTVVVTYEDKTGTSHEVKLMMKKRPGGTKISDNFPTIYINSWSKILPDNIGYIYFSAFLPPADSLFLSAVSRLSEARALIIDIRGNPGGSHEIGETIASKLLTKPTLFSIFQYRNSVDRVTVNPTPPIFDKPVVIMIDALNASASERFTGCMQAIERAKVIGDRSSGSVGPSELKRLPNGATFMYLVAQSTTPKGDVLEGVGVIPDIPVSLDRKELLKGVDTQLENAIAFLKSVMK